MKQNTTLTINFPINTPNKNGTVLTSDAILNALHGGKTRPLPVVDREERKVLGMATMSSDYLLDDHCAINYDCFIYEDECIDEFDMRLQVNESHKDDNGITIIDDCRILGITIIKGDKT